MKVLLRSIIVIIVPAIGLALLAGCGKKAPPLPPLPPEQGAAIGQERDWQDGVRIKAGAFIRADES